MPLFEAIISGFVQGITEFLPVSSSGHLVILEHLLGKGKEFGFIIFVHIGTLIALLLFFWRDILSLLTNKRMLFLLLIASIPAGIVGFTCGDTISQLFAQKNSVGIMLLVNGVWLLSADISLRRKKERAVLLSFSSAFLIGCAQVAALIPGISRSGITISTGILCNLEKETAFKFSFLLSIPVILGAFLFALKNSCPSWDWAVVFAIIISTISGLFSLKFFLHLIKKSKLFIFALYCFLIGIAILML